jgi:hypothetical protein
MNQNRSMALASYERYVSVFIFGTMILTMFITINLEVLKSTNNYNFSKYKKYFFLLVLILFYFYNGLYSTRMFVTMNPDVNFVKIEKFNVKPLRESVFKLHESEDKKNIVALFQENRANIKWIILKYMLSPHHDVFEIKFNEDHDDVKRKLFSSDILVYDQIDSNKMMFIASFFHQFNLSQPKVNACYIIKNNHEINCIN